MSETVEAEVVEETPVPAEAAALVPRHSREVLMPADAEQVIAGMRAYQQLLHELLEPGDWQETAEGRFPKKSAWRKIARAFNLSVEIVSLQVDRDEEGAPTRAECVARASAPNGQTQDADGYCSLSEFTGKRAGDTKLENTLRATATTRAKNRAIADLVGMGEVSAEEVEAAGGEGGNFTRATEERRKLATKALGRMVGDAEKARDIWASALAGFGGVAPASLVDLLIALEEAGK